jgi:hypothetical protein
MITQILYFMKLLNFHFFAIDLDYAPPFVLNVYDKDSGMITSSSDFIGRSVILMNEAEYSQDGSEIPKPKWHSIKMGFNDNEPEMGGGQILVSFGIVDEFTKFELHEKNLRIAPETDTYKIEINVLGLRNLQSAGILPVKKPFIKFDLKSLMPPSKAEAIDNIKTEPSATGPNPTISTVIKFTTRLPVETLYCPCLSCAVYYCGMVPFPHTRVGEAPF